MGVCVVHVGSFSVLDCLYRPGKAWFGLSRAVNTTAHMGREVSVWAALFPGKRLDDPGQAYANVCRMILG